MFCPKCAAPNLENASYCRSCGGQIKADTQPSTLNGHAIAKFIIGDAFVIPAVLLMMLESSVQTSLWILLAVPGFLLYTWAVADIIKARSITRRRKELARPVAHELTEPMPDEAAINFAGSVTDRTTRELIQR